MPVMAFLDSGIKNCVLGTQLICHIQNPPLAMQQGIALCSLQRGMSLSQVPMGSASPSPSQEANLFFPDLVFSVTDAWNSSMKQFSFLVEILVLMCAVPGTQTLESEVFCSDHCPSSLCFHTLWKAQTSEWAQSLLVLSMT